MDNTLQEELEYNTKLLRCRVEILDKLREVKDVSVLERVLEILTLQAVLERINLKK